MSLFMEIASCVVEVFIYFFYFNGVLKRKDISDKKYYGFLAGTIMFNIARSYLYLAFEYNILITVAIWIVMALVCFKDNKFKKMFFVALNVIALMTSEIVTAVILSSIHQIKYDDGFTMRYLGMIMTNLTLFMLDIYIIQFAKKKYRKLPLKFNILTFLCPAFSVFILMLLDNYIAQSYNHHYIMALIAVAGIGYINVMICNFFDYYRQSLESSTLKTLYNASVENYKLRTESDDEIRMMSHNIRGDMLTIRELMKEGDNKKVEECVDEIERKFSKYSSVSRTGHPSLDSILNYEYRKAYSLGVNYNIKTNLSENILINDIDLSDMLYNAIDNAIEACMKTDEKYILVSVTTCDGFMKMSIENTSLKVAIDDNKISTTKLDRKNHGYGILSMKTVAEKYDGSVDLSYKNGIFSCVIIIKNLSKNENL